MNEALRAHESMQPSSLDAPAGGDDDSPVLGDTLAAADRRMERAETMAAIAVACRGLNLRDRRILYLRFFQDKTQQEIGEELGVTQMQISRLLARILAELRTRLSADDADDANDANDEAEADGNDGADDGPAAAGAVS